MYMVGERIYELRKRKGLSQEDLASELGVSRQTISNWESGQTAPDLKQATKLAEVFDVSLDELSGKEKTISVKVETKKPIMPFWKGVGIVVVGLFGFFLILTLLAALSAPNRGDAWVDDFTVEEYEEMIDEGAVAEYLVCEINGIDAMFTLVDDGSYSHEWRTDLPDEVHDIIDLAQRDENGLINVEETLDKVKEALKKNGIDCESFDE